MPAAASTAEPDVAAGLPSTLAWDLADTSPGWRARQASPNARASTNPWQRPGSVLVYSKPLRGAASMLKGLRLKWVKTLESP